MTQSAGLVLAYASPRGIGRVRIESAPNWATISIRPRHGVSGWLLLLLAMITLLFCGMMTFITLTSRIEHDFVALIVPSIGGILFAGAILISQINRIGRTIAIEVRDGTLAFEVILRVGFARWTWSAREINGIRLETDKRGAGHLKLDLKDADPRELLFANDPEELRPIAQAMRQGLLMPEAEPPVTAIPRPNPADESR